LPRASHTTRAHALAAASAWHRDWSTIGDLALTGLAEHFIRQGATDVHHLLPIDRERLLQRFLQYVQIATAAQPDATSYPSSTGQLELGRLLVEQLQSMGLNTARQDQHGLVWATVPATVPQAPGILLNAHLDTSPEAPGHDVRPQIVKPYVGGDIALGGAGQFIRASDCPALEH